MHTTPENTYWNLETRLKIAESALDACLGANGAIYAVRRALFWHDIPANTIVDDFVIGMKVREAGRRVVYEPAAVACEALPHARDEWRRRVRIGAGAFQALILCRRCLHPRFGWFAWFFWSHKVLRWLTPHLMLLTAALALGGLVAGGTQALMCMAILGSGVGLLVCAGIGRRFAKAGHIFRLCDHFVSMQAALFVGFLRFCRGNLVGAWERTPRGEEVGGR